MKPSLFKTLTIAVFSLSLIAAAPAFAGKKNHGNHHNNHGYNSHNNHGYSNHNSHNKHYRGHSSHHSNHKADYIIGGIIGGVILSNVFNNLSNNRHSQTYSTTYSNYPARYANNVVVSSTPYTTYRVLNGNECYLVNVNKYGNEVLTQVPNMNCGY